MFGGRFETTFKLYENPEWSFHNKLGIAKLLAQVNDQLPTYYPVMLTKHWDNKKTSASTGMGAKNIPSLLFSPQPNSSQLCSTCSALSR
ncbi:hypothetical protein [Brevibacillus centrosporus]|uniref:hypothetical protein n=1 Tax=Brevibacillus centrosporus TaxID=54910 RepID=UPI002E1F17E7|nr:hypothetical protein [Brevibacillus centrosporus]